MPLKAKITEINWVAKWTFNCINHECPICRNHVESSSIHGGDKFCMGECGHGYHEDCLTKWFQQLGNVEKKCPVCFNLWKELKVHQEKENIYNLKFNSIDIINQGLNPIFNIDFSNNINNVNMNNVDLTEFPDDETMSDDDPEFEEVD